MNQQPAGNDLQKRTVQGETTHRNILNTAMNLASKEGLEGISIGRLSSALGMSKSGLFAHFGSKEELQLATIENACSIYNEEIVKPALQSKHGLDCLLELCERWLSYHESDIFPGGCFFLAVSSEFDSRSGPVRERIVKTMSQWLFLLKRELLHAMRSGEIDPNADPEQIAFEINAIGHGANWAYQLYGDRSVFQKARISIQRILNTIKNETSGNSGAIRSPAPEPQPGDTPVSD